jgi:hypothetical protein
MGKGLQLKRIELEGEEIVEFEFPGVQDGRPASS